jgi:hypothetical protein
LRHPLATRLLHGQCNPKVRDQRVAALQENVLGLDVAVNDAESVCVRQRIRDSGGEANRLGDGQLPSRSSRASPCTNGMT